MASMSIPRVAVLLVSFVVFSTASSSSVLTTTLGDVTGSQRTLIDQTVEIFYGIPFAKPPTGSRRFKAPEPADSWSGQVLDGTVKPAACWQVDDTTFPQQAMWNAQTAKSEDCLYLNVWRRQPVVGEAPKTIMVWIHGGGFYSGSSVLDVYDGSDFAARRDIIVVTIAYRLGPLGFIYLENDADVPGNAGLRDQIMALQWVYDNAENLGGSTEGITIFGQGAGAASVGFHILSPLSKNLFNNAIMQSGSPTNVWAVAKTPRIVKNVKNMTDTFCSGSSSDQFLSCLQGVSAEDLTVHQWNLDTEWFDVPFGPIVDNAVLVRHPQESVDKGLIDNSTNLIVGYNLNEGTIWSTYLFPQELPLDNGGSLKSEDVYRNMILTIAQGHTNLQTDIFEIYSREHKGNNKRRMRIVEAAMGDFLFKCGQVEFAKKYAELGGTVYVYTFEEKFSTSPWPGWMGVVHRDEIPVVFGVALNPGSTNTDAEKALTKEVQGFWASFARHGAPKYKDIDWRMFTSRYEDYLKIYSKGSRRIVRPRMNECEVWDRFRHQVNPTEAK